VGRADGAVGERDFEGGIGQEFGVVAPLGVEQVVVAGAEQHEVVEGGGAAVLEPADVVALAPAWGRSSRANAFVSAAPSAGMSTVSIAANFWLVFWVLSA
jgi:hypothetical protein